MTKRYTRDYEGDFGESSRDFGWDEEFDRYQRDWSPMEMRQNDFGTRRMRHNNFRETRWGADHSGKGPKGWKRSDQRITEDACEALFRHPEVDASEIEVSVEGGVLTLKGTVDSRQVKKLAEECVEEVEGVADVLNLIRVLRPSEHLSSETPFREEGSALS